MNYSEILSIFRNIGLTQNEGSLYLASLELGESGMSDLAHKAKLNRSTAYLTFNSLQKRGIMGSFKNRSGQKFVSTNPQVVLSRLKEQHQEFADILPQLRALQSESEYSPNISFYKGEEGYYIAAKESLVKPGEIIRHIGSLQGLYKVVDGKYDNEVYVPDRIKNNIYLKALYFESDLKSIPSMTSASDQLREVRIIPDNYHYESSTLIFNDTVVSFSSKNELFTVITKSHELAQAEKMKFDMLWDKYSG